MKVKFQDVLDHFGGTHQTLADKLGLQSREAVTMWGGKIPESQAYKIEVLSGGKFKVADMPVKYRRKAKPKQVNGGGIGDTGPAPG